jgi:hypothetical protein
MYRAAMLNPKPKPTAVPYLVDQSNTSNSSTVATTTGAVTTIAMTTRLIASRGPFGGSIRNNLRSPSLLRGIDDRSSGTSGDAGTCP